MCHDVSRTGPEPSFCVIRAAGAAVLVSEAWSPAPGGGSTSAPPGRRASPSCSRPPPGPTGRPRTPFSDRPGVPLRRDAPVSADAPAGPDACGFYRRSAAGPNSGCAGPSTRCPASCESSVLPALETSLPTPITITSEFSGSVVAKGAADDLSVQLIRHAGFKQIDDWHGRRHRLPTTTPLNRPGRHRHSRGAAR